jgi:hypothetical protein
VALEEGLHAGKLLRVLLLRRDRHVPRFCASSAESVGEPVGLG